MGKLKELIFIFIRFFSMYGVLLFIYDRYLNKYNVLQNTIDPYTKQLSIQVSILLNKIGLDNSLVLLNEKKSMGIYLKDSGALISHINEGCNIISVMIIFVAFAFTFYKGFFKTLGFIFFGLVILYFSNLFRIMFLNIIFYYYSDYGRFSHDVIFPAIIYGTVVLLWVLWILYANSDKYKY